MLFCGDEEGALCCVHDSPQRHNSSIVTAPARRLRADGEPTPESWAKIDTPSYVTAPA